MNHTVWSPYYGPYYIIIDGPYYGPFYIIISYVNEKLERKFPAQGYISVSKCLFPKCYDVRILSNWIMCPWLKFWSIVGLKFFKTFRRDVLKNILMWRIPDDDYRTWLFLSNRLKTFQENQKWNLEGFLNCCLIEKKYKTLKNI